MHRFCCLLAIVAIALSGCGAPLKPPEQLGELVVAVRDTPGYYQGDDASGSGFEHDLVQLFGRELGVKTRFVVTRDHAELLKLLRQGKVHFAAVSVANNAVAQDWRLLAALAYQESGWDPLATSFTGVRGIMMLTDDTADRMHVNNRLDPKQSIAAGAKYLADLIDALPAEVKQPDRTWLALAAYNLGQGHMNGARAIAIGLKRDPDSWYEMKRVLPLMARQKYYQHLKSGRTRGGEAVIMVENVRTFYDILTRFEPPYRPDAYGASMLAIPPMVGRRTSGTVTLPSAF